MQAGMEEYRFKGEKAQSPNILLWVHSTWDEAARLASLFFKLYILAGSLSVPIIPPDQNSRFIFQESWNLFFTHKLKM